MQKEEIVASISKPNTKNWEGPPVRLKQSGMGYIGLFSKRHHTNNDGYSEFTGCNQCFFGVGGNGSSNPILLEGAQIESIFLAKNGS